MSFVLISAGEEPVLAASAWRIPRAQLTEMLEAAEALSAARAVRGQAQGAAEDARRQAFAEGLAAGRDAGAREAAARLSQTIADNAAAMERERQELRAKVGALALDVVRRITADIAPAATLQALAERAVREVLPDQPVTVRVAPEAAPAVGQRLWGLDAVIEVRPDPSLGPTDCRIETPRGRADASLEVQLAALERAFAVGAAQQEALA